MNLDRRGFVGFSLAAVGGIFVRKYDGPWFRRKSGIVVPETMIHQGDDSLVVDEGWVVLHAEKNGEWVEVDKKRVFQGRVLFDLPYAEKFQRVVYHPVDTKPGRIVVVGVRSIQEVL